MGRKRRENTKGFAGFHAGFVIQSRGRAIVFMRGLYSRLRHWSPPPSLVRGLSKITRTDRGGGGGGRSGVARSEITWARRGREERPPNLNSPRHQNGGDLDGWRWHTCLTASGQ